MHSLVRDYIQFSRVTEYAQSSQVLCTVYSLAMQSLVGLLTMHRSSMHSYANCHFLRSTPESPAASAECGNLLDRSPTCLLNRRDTHWWLGGRGGDGPGHRWHWRCPLLLPGSRPVGQREDKMCSLCSLCRTPLTNPSTIISSDWRTPHTWTLGWTIGSLLDFASR